jgi:hypothetical protein
MKLKKLWQDIIFIYTLIIVDEKTEYKDEYLCAFINYDMNGGVKHLKPHNKKYKDLYFELCYTE